MPFFSFYQVFVSFLPGLHGNYDQMIFQTSRCSNPNNSELLQVKETKIGRELKHWVYFTKIIKNFFG